MKRSTRLAPVPAMPAASPPRSPDPDLIFDDGNPSRRALLLAGLEVFGEKGLEVATTREIAALAGQNVAAIAYYFENKEGLYLAIARELAREVSARTGPAIAAIEAQKQLTPAIARTLLRELVSTLTVAILRTGEQAAFTQFMLREQQRPTAAFDLLYAGGVNRVHEALTRLLATVLGLSPDSSEAQVRTHALFGQILAFRVARALILRRTGWTEFGPDEVAVIERGVLANLDALCTPGIAKPRQKQRPRKPARNRKE